MRHRRDIVSAVESLNEGRGTEKPASAHVMLVPQKLVLDFEHNRWVSVWHSNI